jgi:general secretion pathway protein C
MRLELNARARVLLRRFPRTNLYAASELLLLAVLAVQCARLVWVVVTPVSPLGDWRAAQPGIAGAPGDLLRGFDPFFRLDDSSAKPAAVTALKLTVFGIRVNEATGGGSAIIATPDGTQDSYAVGDTIMPGVTLKGVAFDHVTIDHGGATENLFIDQSQPAAPVAAPPPAAAAAPTAAHVPLLGLGGAGMSLAQLKQGVGFIPRIDKGQLTGLVVRPSGDGAIFAKAGLHQGDIIVEVMGKPVTGPEDISAAAAKLQNGGILSLMVERDGRKLPIGIDVTGS